MEEESENEENSATQEKAFVHPEEKSKTNLETLNYFSYTRNEEIRYKELEGMQSPIRSVIQAVVNDMPKTIVVNELEKLSALQDFEQKNATIKDIVHHTGQPVIEDVDKKESNTFDEMEDDPTESLISKSNRELREKLEAALKKKFAKPAMESLVSIYDETDNQKTQSPAITTNYQQNPEEIQKIYETETNETIIHILARGGNVDCLKDICDEEKTLNRDVLSASLIKALTIRDGFDQTPVLASFRGMPTEESNATAEFLLSRIEHFKDQDLIKDTLQQVNKANSSVLIELLRNVDVYQSSIKVYFRLFTSYCQNNNMESFGFHGLVEQIGKGNSEMINSQIIGNLIHEIHDASPEFFGEDKKLFSYSSPTSNQNLLMKLAVDTEDSGLRELVMNPHTSRHISHEVLQTRDREGQTLLALMEVNRNIMTESLSVVLKKEFACHRNKISRTEDCFAKQLESSITSEQILKDLNRLEDHVPCSVYFGVFCGFFFAFTLWVLDVYSDSLLTMTYHSLYQNITGQAFDINSKMPAACHIEYVYNTTNCNFPNKSAEMRNECRIFDDLQTTDTMPLSPWQQFIWTLTFILLPLVLNVQEYVTLNDKYEITGTRENLINAVKNLKTNLFSCHVFYHLLSTFFNMIITFIVIIVWTPLTALYQWYWTTKHDLSFRKEKVKARQKKRIADLTASRGDLCCVNIEDVFEPIVQGYIMFPYLVKLFRKLGKLVSLQGNSIVFQHQCFTNFELAQMFSILTSLGGLVFSYSEYHSVKKNDLLWITESPFTRIVMMFGMLSMIISRLGSFLLFSYFWPPGNLYPIMVFILGHMAISGLVHVIFSEDIHFLRKGQYLKFFHNVLMNSLANIYFHNYIRFDERPEIEVIKIRTEENINRQKKEKERLIPSMKKKVTNDQVDSIDVENSFEKKEVNTVKQIEGGRGIHLSTFFRQLIFEVIFIVEMVLLCEIGLSDRGFLKHCYSFCNTTKENVFRQIVYILYSVGLLIKIIYYGGLHIWSNSIVCSRLNKSKIGEIKIFGCTLKNFVEYAWEFNNTWIVGDVTRSIKITLWILPKAVNDAVCEQWEEIKANAEKGIGLASKSYWKRKARNLLNCRKTLTMVALLPLILLGILIPFIILLAILIVITIMIPFTVILIFYNIFATHHTPDFGDAMDALHEKIERIVELPNINDLGGKEAHIVDGKNPLSYSKMTEMLQKGFINLGGRQKITMDELNKISFLAISHDSEKYEINLDDMLLDDDKFEAIIPMIARFGKAEIGGRQAYTGKALRKLQNYIKNNNWRTKLQRLQIEGSTTGASDILKKVNEELEDFAGFDRKKDVLNSLADLLPYLHEICIKGLLKSSAYDTVTNIDGPLLDLHLWDRINDATNLDFLGLRDCTLNDFMIEKCISGIANAETVDISENPKISPASWMLLIREFKKGSSRLKTLVYEGCLLTMDHSIAFKEMLHYLTSLDLSQSQFESEALQTLLGVFAQEDQLSESLKCFVNLSGCKLKKEDIDLIENINRKQGNVITYDNQAQGSRCSCYQ